MLLQHCTKREPSNCTETTGQPIQSGRHQTLTPMRQAQRMCTLRTWTGTVTSTSFHHRCWTTPSHGTRTMDKHHRGGHQPTLTPTGAVRAQLMLLTWMAMGTLILSQPLRLIIPSHGTQTGDNQRHRLPRPTFPTRQTRHVTCVSVTWTEMEISTSFQHPTRTARLHGTKTTAKQHRGLAAWTSSRTLQVLNR